MRRLSFALGLIVALLLSGTAAGAQGQENAARANTTVAASAPLNLNTATAAQLETLPGIGAKTAQLIVEHRQKNGNFKKVEELMNVKGIGEKSFLKLKPMVTVGDEKK